MAGKPSVILGVSYSHGDSSAAIIVDGCLLAAAEEERFTRVKHYALFPKAAIRYCLQHAKLNPQDVQVVAIARKKSNAWARRLSLYFSHPHLWNHRKNHLEKGPSLSQNLKELGLQGARIQRVEHHFAHMLSARYLTDAPDTAFLSFDGLGDFVSAAMGKLGESGIEILDRVYFPHSVGYFYTALTQYLGFPHFGDEFKVMGLSSYGEPTYLPNLRDLIREKEGFGFELNLEAFPILRHPMTFYIENAQPKINPFYSSNYLTQILGLPPRRPHDPLTKAHWNLAKSVQVRFEEIATHLLMRVHDRVGGSSIALAGGCAHNSVWVGKIPKQTRYKNVFVAPASHDAGIAVGAAIHAAQVPVAPEGGHWGLLGPTVDEGPAYEVGPFPFSCRQQTFANEKALIDWMVHELAEGKIIGLCHGRLEFGPRALGSRSIIADPRLPEMRDRLNQRVKHRESFRPFAASVLWEYQDDWFEDSFFAPTMEAVFSVRPQKRAKIGAVVHADNTCRIQSIRHDTQPFYWNLIEAFRKKTGVPMLINTSFNDSEPIVCNRRDAVHCFTHSEMDSLVINLETYSRNASVLSKTG